MTDTLDVSLDDAYRRCEEITRREARNFSYGIRLLRPPERAAMSALYAVARRIDDIGDGDAPAAEKLSALSAIRRDVLAVAADPAAAGADPVLVALADTCRRYGLPVSALDELIEGCEMDVNGVTYTTIDELVGYCLRVAGTVGRLSLAVYGAPDRARADPLADALGVALQLTNILRDIVEDRETMGRVYLPAEDLARFGVDPFVRGDDDALCALVSFEAARAVEWYDRGLALLPLLDRRSRACTAAMAGIYRRLLERIQRDPLSVTRGRLSLPAWEKAAVAARALTVGRA
ncbi:squalene/phytoene synthase family protein [Acidiferrimicrobium sp. IK]|uniref:phytoene/squalene synthase family protein n=1 Tax=Acidiferrimicrobium sp. IK TaxID=2871700 RepID=UPI0021CAFAFB|nr:squalene/phytoene synthase family protein [Acidiferrimicrobium sp. IK]MCU4184533.1 squalene/phytoene synthase family protein [Acidiferrimicrobium sp. IK]